MGVGKKDHNFFHKVAVSSNLFEDIKLKWGFNSAGVAFMVESDTVTDIVEYSFDGKTVHGDMTPGRPSQGVMFDSRALGGVWFRLATAGSAVLVRVEAWQ